MFSIFSYKKQSFSVNIFLLNVIFSLFYWIMESIRDVILFEKGNVLNRIFNPDPMSFWMRMLMIFILILFSIYSCALHEKIEVKKIQVSKRKDEYGIIWAGIGFGVIYWMLEAFRDSFVFEKGNFIYQLIMPDSIRFWMRILGVLILVLFSLYSQMLINKGRKAEETLKKIHDELEQKILERTIELSKSKEVKMEAIGILAGGVAHYYNNMLTAILGSAELMMHHFDVGNTIYEDLKIIQSVAGRAVDLTHNLLLFSRKNHIRMVSLNLNKLIAEMLQAWNEPIRAHIEIITDLETDLWTIKADRNMVNRMITNILDNAKDALHRRGKIIIKTENVYVDELYCNNEPEAKQGQFIRLTIEDNGQGMSEETLKHIFEPFFTTKCISKNTGLGLAVVYGIVKRHEGWINVTSKSENGSTFRVLLPALATKKHLGLPEKVTIGTQRQILDVSTNAP